MKTQILIVILSHIIIGGCQRRNNGESISGKTLESYNNDSYKEYKGNFEEEFISHFPKQSPPMYFIDCKTNKNKNDVGLILYEYKVDRLKLDSIKKYIKQESIVGQYKSADTCLFIVNRFETINPFKKEVITDSTQINRSCYQGKYPIPNFINYSRPNVNSDIKLDDTFVIYVLDARSGKYSDRYDMSPSPQMPKKWGNGYSKGIALSEKQKTIIYWSIIW